MRLDRNFRYYRGKLDFIQHINLKKDNAFTLIEIIISLTLIGVFFVVLLFAFTSSIKIVNNTQNEIDMNSISRIIMQDSMNAIRFSGRELESYDTDMESYDNNYRITCFDNLNTFNFNMIFKNLLMFFIRSQSNLILYFSKSISFIDNSKLFCSNTVNNNEKQDNTSNDANSNNNVKNDKIKEKKVQHKDAVIYKVVRDGNICYDATNLKIIDKSSDGSRKYDTLMFNLIAVNSSTSTLYKYNVIVKNKEDINNEKYIFQLMLEVRPKS